MREVGPGKSLSVGLKILEAIQAAPEPITYVDLKKRVETSPASFSRFLKILLDSGYVRKNSDGRYVLSWRLIQLGAAALHSSPLRKLAEPHVKAIARDTQETSEYVTYDDDYFLVAVRIETPSSVTLRAPVGSAFRICDGTAMGILAIAFGLSRHDAPGEDLERVRAVGLAEKIQNNGEVYRAAALIRDARGNPAGCLTVAAPAFRVAEEGKSRFQKVLLSRARDFSRELGYASEPEL